MQLVPTCASAVGLGQEYSKQQQGKIRLGLPARLHPTPHKRRQRHFAGMQGRLLPATQLASQVSLPEPEVSSAL